MTQRQSQLKFGGQGLALTVPNQSLQECSFMSNLITDRDSTFLSYFIPSDDPKLLPSYRFMFQECTELKHCNHKMQAWRFPGEVEAYNDDGEEYSGQKLLNTLVKESVYGIVVCVRWYGGQLLGPIRFQHIVDTAKSAIQKYKKHIEENKKKEAWVHATIIQQQQRQPRSVNPLDQKVRQVIAKDRTVNLLRKTLGFPPLQEVDYHSKSLSTLDMLLQSRNSMISALRSELQKNKEGKEEGKSEISKEQEDTKTKEEFGNESHSTEQPVDGTLPSEVSTVKDPFHKKQNDTYPLPSLTMGSSKVSKKEKKAPIWGNSVSDFRKLKSEEKKTLSKDELKQYKKLKHKVKKLIAKKKQEDNNSKNNKENSTQAAEKESSPKKVAAANAAKEKSDDGNKDYWLASKLSGGNQRKSKFLKMLGIRGDGEDSSSKDNKGQFEHERERQLEQQYISGIHQKGNRKGLGM